MKHTKFFKDINKDSVKEAGGKGASLGEMYSSGIPVPNGFVVLANSFDLFIKENNLDLKIKQLLKTVILKKTETIEKASKEIQKLILSGKINDNLLKEIITNFKKLKCKFVAVRSSATAEDSSSAAWAGQLNTHLNTTEKKLIENIQKCWASLYTSRAIFYRFEKKLHDTNISVSVVIQKMVDSEISGIAFSVHPVTEDFNQLIIEAGYGLGEAIVSGQITPDNYVVDKKKCEILDQQINIQSKALYKCYRRGVKWKELTKKKGYSQKLSNKQIINLSKIIIKIEKHYGFPVDIEWAIEKNKIFITQSRPITTLKKI
ncbi:MAG: PEP/pyruvate-binding domain-containing protein [Candidatus ainarchaeum sp.]|nr:PEP/pyruvate-binding domain-containing protein [Candidatus ainarchaeum sp.]